MGQPWRGDPPEGKTSWNSVSAGESQGVWGGREFKAGQVREASPSGRRERAKVLADFFGSGQPGEGRLSWAECHGNAFTFQRIYKNNT